MPTPLPRLTIEADGPSEPFARFADFVWPGVTPDLAVLANVDHTRTLARSRLLPEGDAQVRWVEYFEVDAVTEDGDPAGPLPSDLVRFDLSHALFAETGRWRPDDDRNLHRRGFGLPSVMHVGASVLPAATARATLDWCGRATLAVGEHRVEHRLLRLRIDQGGMQMDQWMAEGVGEIALGRSYGPFMRWMIGWAGGGKTLFGGVPAALASLDLPEPDLDREPAPVRGPL